MAVVVTFLLGGTAAAFALTEQLKLERSPVLPHPVGKLLGPKCRCPLQRVKIGFVLRKPDTVTVVIVDSQGQIVRTLLSGGYRRGAQQFAWDGRNDFGGVVPAGTYKPRLHLARDHRTILMPNPIRVDPTSAGGRARLGRPAHVLARQRRAQRRRPRPLQDERAGAGAAVR